MTATGLARLTWPAGLCPAMTAGCILRDIGKAIAGGSNTTIAGIETGIATSVEAIIITARITGADLAGF